VNNKAVFLDRDGTIIHDFSYIREPNRVELIPGVVQALEILQKNGFFLVIISNQSGVGRGIMNEADLLNVHNKLIVILENNGIHIKKSYFCMHAPWEKCQCRKPNPGMLFKAASEFNINLTNSYMIGDKTSDIEAGLKAGCCTILISDNAITNNFAYKKGKPHVVFHNLLSACQWIIKHIAN
jgi:histidinol-phosphate phosphatase family protein